MTDVSIVSGTYNRLEHLKRMIESARQSAGTLTTEIILVDGGSTDGTIEWAKSQPDVMLIEQGELLGAIAAFNAGARAATGEYVVFLNDDIEVQQKTIWRAWNFLEYNPMVGQVAFENLITGKADEHRRPFSRAFYYIYGQCCMTRRWLGDLAGWWGDEGMRTYGGDSRLGMRIWEMGYRVEPVRGCAVMDWVVDDELRQINDADRRPSDGQGIHPDTVRFLQVWKGRLPMPKHLIPAPINLVLEKAAHKRLRTMRFQGRMVKGQKLRHALMDEFGKLGTAQAIDRAEAVGRLGRDRYQMYVQEQVNKFKPDLLIFQAQRENSVTPDTVRRLRSQHPNCFIINWDGDVHTPLVDFHFEMAKAVHLQLTISPDLFPQYINRGATNIGYWPIGIENEYVVDRAAKLDGPDAVFLGALYGEGRFPEAQTRKDAVIALAQSGLEFELHGPGWEKVALDNEWTREEHGDNARLYARSKMALSVSQAANLWGYTSDRLYNICAAGCPALVQHFAGMGAHGFVDGETCISWATIPEMIEKAQYFLRHPEWREEIGAAGKAMTLARHTWAHRVEGLFAMLRGLARQRW